MSKARSGFRVTDFDQRLVYSISMRVIEGMRLKTSLTNRVEELKKPH